MTRIRQTLGMAAIGYALLLSGCQDDAQFRALGDQIRALESAQAQGKAELSRLQMQMRSLQVERDKIKEERDKLQSQIEEATKALESIQKDFEDYKQQYRVSIRKRAPGMELDVVEVDGKRFEKVKIRELTESSLVFMHQAGTMSVQLSQLNPEMRERLGYQTSSTASVMLSRKSGSASGADVDGEFRAVEEKLTEVKKEMANLQRKLAEVNTAAHNEQFKDEGNPTIHRSAAAAIRVKLNELEVEHRTLYLRSQELAEKIRMSRVR